MIVKASKVSDYLFIIEPHEWSSMKNSIFGQSFISGGLSSSGLGFTFSVYNSVPNRMIKGELFKGVKTKKTRSIESKTDFLDHHGFSVYAASGELFKINDISENPAFEITPDHYRFVCNHIPQINYPSKFGVITGIHGEYDFAINQFKGALQFD